MRHVIVGTAGHIDHGKTQLIKALTGTNTDRLKEEQDRGISIELGFAKLRLDSGRSVGIVDVPGHERFVKNMVAGASGIDMVLLVIAADDGIMPQTREHLAIIDLLGVTRGIVAITKIDIVEKDWLDAITEEVREFLSDTALAEAPIVPVSSVTGEGLDELRLQIERLASQLEEHDESGEFRMPVDRVFVLKGIGTVITGTLWSGKINVSDQVAILPKGFTAKVRSIEVHGEFVDTVFAGQRVALNLAGVEKVAIDRGDMILPPNFLSQTYMFDAFYDHLTGAKPLKTRTRVRLHHGTSEVLARIILLDREALEPGQSTFVQLRLEEPLVTKFKDRYIIRSYSPVATIGGGVILDSHPEKHKANNQKVLEEMKVRLAGLPKEIVRLALAHGLMTEKETLTRTELKPEEVGTSISELLAEGKLLVVETEGTKRFITSLHYNELKDAIKKYFKSWREKNPLSLGVNKETLRSQLLWDLPAKTAETLLSKLMRDGLIIIEGDLIKEAGAQISLTTDQQKLKEMLSGTIKRARYGSPAIKDLENETKLSSKELLPILKILEAEGDIIQIQRGTYLNSGIFSEAVKMVQKYVQNNGKITAADFRDLVKTSRKYAVPLLEYMDLIKITRREGDYRILR